MENAPIGVILHEFRVDFTTVKTALTVAMRLTDSLRPIYYKFDLRTTDGTLLGRADCHPGHENALGSTHHLHLGPGESHRIAALPATLTSIAERITATRIGA